MHSRPLVLGICEFEPVVEGRLLAFLARMGIQDRFELLVPRLVGSDAEEAGHRASDGFRDLAKVFLESKSEFVERVDIAIVRLSPPGMETLSYATSLGRALLRPDSEKRLCVVGPMAANLKRMWEASTLDDERDGLCLAIQSGQLIFTDNLTDEILSNLFRDLM